MMDGKHMMSNGHMMSDKEMKKKRAKKSSGMNYDKSHVKMAKEMMKK